MSPLVPNLAVQPKAQRVLWPSLSQLPTGFVLYGGTAPKPMFASIAASAAALGR